jgi:hypothetical protein
MGARSLEDDLVDVPVECMVRDRDDLLDSVPIVEDLSSLYTVRFLVFVNIGKYTCPAGVEPVGGSLWSVALEYPCGNGFGGWDVVCCVGRICGWAG